MPHAACRSEMTRSASSMSPSSATDARSVRASLSVRDRRRWTPWTPTNDHLRPDGSEQVPAGFSSCAFCDCGRTKTSGSSTGCSCRSEIGVIFVVMAIAFALIYLLAAFGVPGNLYGILVVGAGVSAVLAIPAMVMVRRRLPPEAGALFEAEVDGEDELGDDATPAIFGVSDPDADPETVAERLADADAALAPHQENRTLKRAAVEARRASRSCSSNAENEPPELVTSDWTLASRQSSTHHGWYDGRDVVFAPSGLSDGARGHAPGPIPPRPSSRVGRAARADRPRRPPDRLAPRGSTPVCHPFIDYSERSSQRPRRACTHTGPDRRRTSAGSNNDSDLDPKQHDRGPPANC